MSPKISDHEWFHKTDLSLPRSPEGLLAEFFGIRSKDREIVFDVRNCSISYVRPTREMQRFFQRFHGMLYTYHQLSIQANLNPSLNSRFEAMEMFHQLCSLLAGEEGSYFTPYTRRI